jgi:uncharacterized protein YjcR
MADKISQVPTSAGRYLGRQKCLEMFLDPNHEYTLTEVALKNGMPLFTVKKWAREDNWSEIKKEKRRNNVTQIQQIVTDKLTDEVTDVLLRLQEAHLGAYGNMVELAAAFFAIANEKRKNTPDIDEQWEFLNKQLNVKAVGEWGKILDSGIRGRHEISGARYQDINEAIRTLEKNGFTVDVEKETAATLASAAVDDDFELGDDC